MEGWIKIHRQILNWEWYKDINVKILFIHLLLTANHQEKNWKGQLVKRGQKLTSLQHLANETGLTLQQTRTALIKLKSTGEIAYTTTNKYTLVTIAKYNDYQFTDENITSKITNNQTNEQQTNNKQITTNKNDKNDNNNIYFILLNKYKNEIQKSNFKEKISLIGKCKESEEYSKLNFSEQDKLFYELMSINNKN